MRVSAAAVAPLLAALLLGAVGCTQPDADDDGGALVFHGSLRDDARTLDPALAYDTLSLDVVSSIYETLYQYAYLSETYRVEPLLAADLPAISRDGLTITIPLRQDARYADDPAFPGGRGRPLRAQDFVHALKRLALPELRAQGWWVWDGRIAGLDEFRARLAQAKPADRARLFAAPVEGLRALDDHRLQLRLTRPYPQLLYVLCLPFTAPVPPEAVRAYADARGEIADHPVGTGPFRLAEWRRGKRITLERNRTYHPDFYPADGAPAFRRRGLLADAGKRLPLLDRVRLRIHREQAAAWRDFLDGRVDALPLPADSFAQAITNEVNLSPELSARGVRLSIEAGSTFYFLQFNLADPIVGGADPRLRQAIGAAVDRAEWIRRLTHGRGQAMTSALPPGLTDRPRAGDARQRFDLARARRLLAQSGHPEGRGLPPLRLDMRGGDALNRRLGEMFARQLARIGVRLEVVYNSFPGYLRKARRGRFQIAYGGWAMDYPDAANSYQLLYGPNAAPGPNETRFANAGFDRLFERMEEMAPGPRRAAVVARMERILAEQMPWVYGYYNVDYRLSQPWLLNLRGSEVILNRFKYLRVDPEVRRRYFETRR